VKLTLAPGQSLNHDIPAATWRKLMTREQLRQLAHRHGIACGRNGWNVARNIQSGYRREGAPATFRVEIVLP
jgi:hypothetical protein